MRCPVEGCQMVFGSQSGLWFHNQKDHLKLRHPCHICGKTYTQVYGLVSNHFKVILSTTKKMRSKSWLILVYFTEICVGNAHKTKTRPGSPRLQVWNLWGSLSKRERPQIAPNRDAHREWTKDKAEQKKTGSGKTFLCCHEELQDIPLQSMW